jgi:hypothetical protein
LVYRYFCNSYPKIGGLEVIKGDCLKWLNISNLLSSMTLCCWELKKHLNNVFKKNDLLDINKYFMKKIYSFLLIFCVFLLLLANNTIAQVPQGIPYQAVARNSSGAIITSHPIGLRFTIHDSIATGAIIYRETFTPSTNTLGLFNVNVGTGTVVTGTFNSINWGHNAKFMQVEMDATGGTSYIDMGTQQMMSVPYALYAGSSIDTSVWKVNGNNIYTAFGGTNTSNGGYSVAMGYLDTAIGYTSTAIGLGSKASGYSAIAMDGGNAGGDYSISMGYHSSASGLYCTAIGGGLSSGYNATAIGFYANSGNYLSTALGTGTASGIFSIAIGGVNAAGAYSTAIGTHTAALGTRSTSMGFSVSTDTFAGSFIIGDDNNDTTTGVTFYGGGVPYATTSTAANQMTMRFSGGYQLFSNTATTVGVNLAPGGNSWNTISDHRRKENFIEVDGETFLKKISSFNLTSWNYKGQDAKFFRHYGPMAQDFYASFGHDKMGVIGNDTTIGQADMEGVSFIMIQALERRTAELQKENAELKAQLYVQGKQNETLKAELIEHDKATNRRIDVIEEMIQKGMITEK